MYCNLYGIAYLNSTLCTVNFGMEYLFKYSSPYTAWTIQSYGKQGCYNQTGFYYDKRGLYWDNLEIHWNISYEKSRAYNSKYSNYYDLYYTGHAFLYCHIPARPYSTCVYFNINNDKNRRMWWSGILISKQYRWKNYTVNSLLMNNLLNLITY